MREESLNIHDKHQFELKLGYKAIDGSKNALYNLEMYFFIPYSLDINSHTYEKRIFYKDNQTYIRLKTPNIALRNILIDNDGPFDKLELSCKNLLKDPNKINISNYIHHTKMFCCILKSAIRDHVEFISSQNLDSEVEILIKEYLQLVQEIRIRYKELRKILNIPSISSNLISYYLFGDEFISHTIEEYSFRLVECIDKIDSKELVKYNQDIYKIIKDEISHREKNKIPSIPKVDSNNEEFIFRKSVLKKHIESILFLKTHSERQGVMLEQILFGLAAGISMMFATAIAFFSQIKFGSISIPLFFILVVSYVFKDRIKEWLRQLFSNNLSKNVFDHKIDLYTSENERIGWIKELFYFIKERDIPKEILNLRNRDHITEIENDWLGEKSAVYISQVKLHSQKLKGIYKEFNNIEGINSIMRFDISRFLNKMDDSQKPVFILSGEGHKVIYGERVYHLNLVIKYSIQNDSWYQRFRIVINQEGIKRIENIVSEKTASNDSNNHKTFEQGSKEEKIGFNTLSN